MSHQQRDKFTDGATGQEVGQHGPSQAVGVTTRSAALKREGSAAPPDSGIEAGDSSANDRESILAQMRDMQRELDRLRLDKQMQPQHDSQHQQQQQQQQQQPQRAPPQVRMSAVQPGELLYHKASEGTALPDWLFKLEQLLSQLGVGVSEFDERVRIAAMHWDRQTNVWWSGHAQQAAKAGVPVTSWAAFVAALNANFVPTNDAETAASELLRLRMRGGESMDAYLQRAALLLARADGRLPDVAAARAALDGVDSSRFPFAVAAARKVMRTATPPLSFHALRVELTALAVDEPSLGGRFGGAAGAGGRSSAPGGAVTAGTAGGKPSSSAGRGAGGGSSSSSMTRKQLLHRISALESGHYAYDDGEDADEAADDGGTAVHTAPVSAKRSAGRQAAASRPASDSSSSGSHRQRRCFKCGSPDHGVRECTSKKELRSCLACHEQGHLVAACPQVRRGGSGEEGAPRPKNE